MEFIGKFKDLIGKTIKRAGTAEYGEDVYLVFDDGTYTYFMSSSGYDGETEIEIEEPCEERILVEVGIMTIGERQVLILAREKEKAIMNEVRERATYEALKRKFEGGTDDGTIVVMKRRV